MSADNELRVCASAEVSEGGRLVLDIGDKSIGIFRVEADLYAYLNICPHAGGPVCQGKMLPRVRELMDDDRRSVGHEWVEDEPHIICPWHGFEYEIKTGVYPNQPQFKLRKVEVWERDGDVFVERDRFAGKGE